MRGDLGRARSFAPNLRQMLFDLATARAGRLEILLGKALDLRLAMPAALDLVAPVLQPRGKLRPIDRGRKLWGLEQPALLKRTCLQFPDLAVLALSDIEYNCMGVKLRRCVAVDGSGGVML